jgi:hypothetical protein
MRCAAAPSQDGRLFPACQVKYETMVDERVVRGDREAPPSPADPLRSLDRSVLLHLSRDRPATRGADLLGATGPIVGQLSSLEDHDMGPAKSLTRASRRLTSRSERARAKRAWIAAADDGSCRTTASASRALVA